MKKSFLISLLSFLIFLSNFSFAESFLIEKKIVYHAPFANEVYMIWGIDNWQQLDKKYMPTGTKIKDNLMITKLKKENENFTANLVVPLGCRIDFLFNVTKGPFNLVIDHWDVNYGNAERDYHTYANSNVTAFIYPDLSLIKPPDQFSFLNFGKYLFSIFLTLIVLIFLIRKFFLKKPLQFSINFSIMITAVAIALFSISVFIRATITGTLWMFLISPFSVFVKIFTDTYYDSLLLIFITSFFLCLLFLLKNPFTRKTLFFFFLFAAAIFLFAGIMNIKVVEYLGTPFSYKWFHFSGFLKSADAKNAILANFDQALIINCFYILFSSAFISLIVYFLLSSINDIIKKKKKKQLYISFFCGVSTYILIFYFFIPQQSRYNKTANPIYFFLSSMDLFSEEGLFTLENKESEKFEFQRSILDSELKAKFSEAGIENVLLFVLESTPAEYVSIYNKQWQVTPILDSIVAQSAIFKNAYSSSPSTNKSMVSLLCGVYPWLSYQNITLAKPDIKIPSLSSIFKGDGYRTAFFNSGDTDFNNAKGFLNNHSFDFISDSKNNNCKRKLAYEGNCFGCDGSSDECLSTAFFNWLDQHPNTPFLSTLWTYQTHYPYFASSSEVNYTQNKELNRFLNALKDGDRVLGEIIKGLKSRKLLEKTLIVILGDHGEAFGRHEQYSHASNIYEENIHIPLIFYNEKLFKGEKHEKLATISDIAPTVCSLFGKPVPKQWQGDILFSGKTNRSTYFFAPWADNWFGIREGKYKLLYNATLNEYELYDLENDPFEEKNIENEQAEISFRLKKKLRGWVKYQKVYMNKLINQ